MVASLARRLAFIALILACANALGFAYAHLARYVQLRQSPYGTAAAPPDLGALYGRYLQAGGQWLLGQPLPSDQLELAGRVAAAAGASFGLLICAAGLSVTLGLAIGLSAVRVEPAGVAGWLTPLASLGLAMPSFYLGTLCLAAALFWVVRGGGDFPLPLTGFGWDLHLVLPVLALVARPTLQIAQVTAALLADEFTRQYVVTARSFGHPWRTLRWKHTLRNALAPALLTVFGSLRLMLGELVLVEWLFNWPGLGRLMAQALVPPLVVGPGGYQNTRALFLNPELLAALAVIFALLFLLTDLTASQLARRADPRLRLNEPLSPLERAHD